MCFGYDGEAALQRSLEQQGRSRRQVLRTTAAGVGGAAALAAVAGAAPASAKPGKPKGGKGGGGGRERQVQEDRISIQLYTLRSAATDRASFDLVMKRLSQYGYPRVERANLGYRTAAELRSLARSLDIWVSSSHDGISADSAALEKKLQDAVTLGQKYIVVPYLNSNSLSDWQRWADQMNTEARRAKRYGLAYGYHNHAHEFTIQLSNGQTPWEVFMERLDPRLVHLEVDLYWAYTGGVQTGATDPDQFVIDTIRQAPPKVRQYHVKDRDTAGDFADLGTGTVDFARIFSAHQVEEYIVENDQPDVTPLTTAAVGRCYLGALDF